MKNLLLTLVLIVLMVLGYIFFGSSEDEVVSSGERFFIHTKDSISKISLSQNDFLKKQDEFFLMDRKVEDSKLGEIINRLKMLKIDRKLEGAVSAKYFPPERTISLSVLSAGRTVIYDIGAYSHVSGKFYGRKREPGKNFDVFLLEDKYINEGVYTSEQDANFSRFAELITLLKKEPYYFYAQKVIPKKWIIVEVEAKKKNQTLYTLNLQRISMTPKPLSYLKVNKRMIISFFERLQLLNYQQRVSPKDWDGNIEREFIIRGPFGEEKLKLYSSAEQMGTLAMQVSDDEELSILDFNEALFLFQNPQDFWHRQLNFKGQPEFPEKIIIKPRGIGNTFTLKVDLQEDEYRVQTIGQFKARKDRLKQIVQALIPGPLQTSAKMVSSSKLEQQHQYQLYFMGKTLGLSLLNNKIVITDIEQGLTFHFVVEKNRFSGTVTDLFSDFSLESR